MSTFFKTRARYFRMNQIRELRVTLKDRSRSLAERRFALRFLVHLVEDLHMPMHVGENHDKGGNDLQVRWFDRGSNLRLGVLGGFDRIVG